MWKAGDAWAVVTLASHKEHTTQRSLPSKVLQPGGTGLSMGVV
jgi:hypothetical protein